MGSYAWALWLATPLVATVGAALVAWWRGRERRPIAAHEAMHDHEAYLAALGRVTGHAGEDPARRD